MRCHSNLAFYAIGPVIWLTFAAATTQPTQSAAPFSPFMKLAFAAMGSLIDRSDTVGFHFGIRHYCSNKISRSPVISDPRVYICYGSKATTFVIAAILRLIHMFKKIPLVVCGLITSSLDKRDFLSRQNDSLLASCDTPSSTSRPRFPRNSSLHFGTLFS